jgi:hypothetical protein
VALCHSKPDVFKSAIPSLIEVLLCVPKFQDYDYVKNDLSYPALSLSGIVPAPHLTNPLF